jgi:CO/xanthine dehydrogenase FAD-binding subunit
VSEFLKPRTADELRRVALEGRFLAGGTDLLVQIRAGRCEPCLIDLSNLTNPPPCVSETDGYLELSALAPISRVVFQLAGRLPAIASAAATFGSLQIRNRATIGGNLANASPAADMVPPLVAADAVALLDGPGGSRELSVRDLASGPGHSTLVPGEWISLLRVPAPKGKEGYRKLGGRLGMAISIVALAWRWTVDDAGVLGDVKLAAGSVAPTVVRCRDAENELDGHRPSGEVIKKAVTAIRSAVSPIDDVRASAWYRKEALGGLLEEALLATACGAQK